MANKRVVLAATGASGGLYAVRLLDCLEDAGVEVHLVVSPFGRELLAEECGVKAINAQDIIGRSSDRVAVHDFHDLNGRLAGGSFLTDGMVICPCSSNTLGKVASGLGDNLIARAAHVTLKEARRLVIVHREMPISAIDTENMLKLQRAGAIICPASPGFYMKPKSIGELVDFVVAKVLDLMGVEHTLAMRWEGPSVQARSTHA